MQLSVKILIQSPRTESHPDPNHILAFTTSPIPHHKVSIREMIFVWLACNAALFKKLLNDSTHDKLIKMAQLVKSYNLELF